MTFVTILFILECYRAGTLKCWPMSEIIEPALLGGLRLKIIPVLDPDYQFLNYCFVKKEFIPALRFGVHYCHPTPIADS